MNTSSKSIQLPPTMCLKPHHNNNNKQKLLVIHRPDKTQCFSLLSTEEDDNSIITFSNPGFGSAVAGCHELLLTLRGEYGEHEKLALWDLSTKDFIKTLPQPPRPPPSVEYDCYNNLFGLGLAAPGDDYKVIRYHEVIDVDDDYSKSSCFMGFHVAELFSLKTESWKRIPFPFAYKACPIRGHHGHPVHINGFSYWPAFTGPRNEQLAIMSFDFANEIFPCDLIPGPGGYKLGKVGQYHFLLAEFEGSLALVAHLVEDKLTELWVWNHDKEGSWSRRGAWAISGAKFPLALLKNHLFYFQDSMGELVLFDCAKQKLKKLGLCSPFGKLQTLPFVSLTRTT